MSKRISDQPVVNRADYPKQMIYLDGDGYVCVADRPQPLSDEEKAKRKAARDKERQAKVKEGQKLREAIKKSNQEYIDATKTRDVAKIQKALAALNAAQEEYNKFKGQ